MAVHSLEDPRVFDLARLKHHVAVRENDRRPTCAEPLDYVEGAGIKRMFAPVTLKCAEIISIAQLDEELFEDRPVPVSGGCPEFTLEVALQVIRMRSLSSSVLSRRLEKRLGWGHDVALLVSSSARLKDAHSICAFRQLP